MAEEWIELFAPFENLADPRVERTRAHDLFDIVVIAVCATIAGADAWTEIEQFAKQREDWLRTFLKLRSGVPSHDTFGRVFAKLDPVGLCRRVVDWLEATGRELGRHVAIDGKTLRGSFDAAAGRNPLHLVSAWSSAAKLTLGQVAVDDKSNEITAIPLLLDLLDLNGAVVTIDAMGCQKEIAEQIVAGGGDYVLALKANHEKLHAAVEAAFLAAADANFRGVGARRHVTVDRAHGRDERREYVQMPVPADLPGAGAWRGLQSIGMVVRVVVEDGVERGEAAYHLSSLPVKVKNFAAAVRGHWSIENSLHWVLDVTFSEDRSRIRQGNAAQTSAQLRRMAVSIIASDTRVKGSTRGKRYAASLSIEVLERILRSFASK